MPTLDPTPTQTLTPIRSYALPLPLLLPLLFQPKVGAGNTVRLTKLLLKRAGLRVYFDADDLISLDLLFEAVKTCRQLVVILSGETTTRPYCVGEITVAHQNGIPILPILLRGTSYASFAETVGGQLSDLQSLSGEDNEKGFELSEEVMATLGPYEMEEGEIRAALSHLRSLPVMSCGDATEAASTILGQKLYVHLPQRKKSLSELEELGPSGGVGGGTGMKGMVRKVAHLVLADFSNLESVSVATYLQLQLAEKLGKSITLAIPTPKRGEILSLQQQEVETISQVCAPPPPCLPQPHS